MSLYADAEREFERALSLRRRELGENHPDTLAVMGRFRFHGGLLIQGITSRACVAPA